jgi:hypothetical protein
MQIINSLPIRDNIGYFLIYSKEITNNTTFFLEVIKTIKRFQENFNIFSILVNIKISLNPLFIIADSNKLGS